jgi:Ca-activated chloride channel family protein
MAVVPTHRLHLTLFFTLIATAWTSVAVAQQRCQPASLLVQRSAEDDAGSLAFEAELGLDAEALEVGRIAVSVRVRLGADVLRLMHGPGGWAQVCIALVADAGDELVVTHSEVISAVDLDRAAAFDYGVDIDLPEDTAELIAVVELPALGVWGAVAVDEADGPLPPPGPEAVPINGPKPAWYRIIGRAQPAPPVSDIGSSVIKLVPPRKQPVTGSTRIYALTSTPEIDRVEFFLDGERVGGRGFQPYFESITFARPARPQTVRAVAYDRRDFVMGEDELVVNPRNTPFRVAIGDFDGDPRNGSVTIEATVAVPQGAELASVEIFRNETIIQRFETPPFRTEVPTPNVTPTDYVRVAAILTDGRAIDDVMLLLEPGLTESVEVNLVPIFAVVQGAQGKPLRDLDRDDFSITIDGASQAIEDFRFADDVPLVLGLVVDTSGSMTLVIEDTRRAAVGFLSKILGDDDRGFVVDFDKQPRLRQATTSDTVALLRAVGMLEAQGETSLYDAIVFSMLQFERESGRRALVVLTDGVDLESRFGPRDCIAYGQRLGVPIYLIAMQTLGGEKFPRKVLNRVTNQTGGGLYLIDSIENLPATYEAIETDLRSQFALSFYTDQDLTAKERAAIEVRVNDPDATVRVVVGSGTFQ